MKDRYDSVISGKKGLYVYMLRRRNYDEGDRQEEGVGGVGGSLDERLVLGSVSRIVETHQKGLG